jgi:hypothetical protein
MSYSIIQPPFTLKFRDMSADELKSYRKWFLEAIPSRVIELQRAVNSDPNFRAWKPDHNRASVETLGVWLSQQVETRPRTAEEIDRIKGRAAFDFDVSTEELTNRTFSLAMDAGMYFGESLGRHYSHLEWDQPLKDKKFADFGQMVLLGFGRASLNPVRIVVTFCSGIAHSKQTAKRFDEVYGYWSRLANEAKGTVKK